MLPPSTHASPARAIAALLACAFAGLPVSAPAQTVQRCIGPDGRAIYTDRRCDAIGAVDRLPPAAAANGPRLYRGGCPRVLSQLVGEIGAAIQGRDVNRLASVYDWSGISNASAARVLDRLEGVVERPLVDIAPVYRDSEAMPAVATSAPTTASGVPDPAGNAGPATGAAAWMPSWNTGADPGRDAGNGAIDPSGASVGGNGPVPPAAPVTRPRPVALRIEQTLAGSATPVRTVFGLRRSYGCFWLAF
jgi:hypothetical protein